MGVQPLKATNYYIVEIISIMISYVHLITQVKDTILHLEGADVIQHMIDHFDD